MINGVSVECDLNPICTNTDKEICVLCRDATPTILKVYNNQVKCPLLDEYIEDDQCWCCYKYNECFGGK